MNPRDGHVHLGQYHEQLGAWVEGHLEEEGLAWGPLTSAELSTIALKVMCSTPRRFAECFFENRPEHGGGPWRFLEPLQTDAIDYPYNTANESAYRGLHGGLGPLRGPQHDRTATGIEFQLSRSAFLSRIFPREAVTRGNNPELRGRVGNAAKLKLTTRGGRQIHSLHIGMALGVLTVLSSPGPSCRALGRSVESWAARWSPGPFSVEPGRPRGPVEPCVVQWSSGPSARSCRALGRPVEPWAARWSLGVLAVLVRLAVELFAGVAAGDRYGPADRHRGVAAVSSSG